MDDIKEWQANDDGYLYGLEAMHRIKELTDAKEVEKKRIILDRINATMALLDYEIKEQAG